MLDVCVDYGNVLLPGKRQGEAATEPPDGGAVTQPPGGLI